MQEEPFDKIQVAHICDRCNMNRKSFYYHFKDKYDLVNWIFDTEFISLAMEISDEIPTDDRWELIERVCDYFYENRKFYQKALRIKGQNSFSDHLREYSFPLVKNRIAHLIGDAGQRMYASRFIVGAVFPRSTKASRIRTIWKT